MTDLAVVSSLPASSATGRVRVLVVDDQEIVHLGLRTAFAGCDWIARTFLTTDPDIAMRIAHDHQPHLALIDLHVAGQSGLLLASRIKELVPSAKIIMMSASGNIDAYTASRHGASAALAKSAPLSVIVETARRIIADRPGPRRVPGVAAARAVLSDREAEILEKIAAGLSNPEIAALLHLSRHTVKQHTSSVYRKLGVRNRAQAASFALQRGLVA